MHRLIALRRRRCGGLLTAQLPPARHLRDEHERGGVVVRGQRQQVRLLVARDVLQDGRPQLRVLQLLHLHRIQVALQRGRQR